MDGKNNQKKLKVWEEIKKSKTKKRKSYGQKVIKMENILECSEVKNTKFIKKEKYRMTRLRKNLR